MLKGNIQKGIIFITTATALISISLYSAVQRSQVTSKTGTLSKYLRDSAASSNQHKSKTGSWIPYIVGKEVIYRPVINCVKPEFLADNRNPCWISSLPGLERKEVCAARVMLLGFHKCGTSDISQWFRSHNHTEARNVDYFYSEKNFAAHCPFTWIEENKQGRRKTELGNKTVYDACPGCILVNRVVKEYNNYIVLESAIQYLQYTMIDKSRYIVTMRKPSHRVISHFFYNLKRENNAYSGYSAEEVGTTFFHKIVSESISTLTRCLLKHGTTVCVLLPELSPMESTHSHILHMITQSCYSTHLKEVFKYIPKELIYFTMLEEHSSDEVRSMRNILKFVGLSVTSVRKVAELGKSVRNASNMTKPVLPETESLLEAFFVPFNIELSELLEDDKWMWL